MSQAPSYDGVLPLARAAVLDNGLQVRVLELHTAPLVSVWCWYGVGSKDEGPGSRSPRPHSYRHPTIGWVGDLRAMRRDDLHGYYRRYYTPGNATDV